MQQSPWMTVVPQPVQFRLRASLSLIRSCGPRVAPSLVGFLNVVCTGESFLCWDEPQSFQVLSGIIAIGLVPPRQIAFGSTTFFGRTRTRAAGANWIGFLGISIHYGFNTDLMFPIIPPYRRCRKTGRSGETNKPQRKQSQPTISLFGAARLLALPHVGWITFKR